MTKITIVAAISPVNCGQIRIKLCDTGSGALTIVDSSRIETKTGPSARVVGLSKATAASL